MKIVLPLLLALYALPLHAVDVEGRWTKVQVKNLVVYSEARDSVTKAIVMDIERMRLALAHVMGLRVDAATPTTIFVFGSEASFQSLRKELTSNPDAAAIFSRTPTAHFVAVRTDLHGMVDALVYHELTHSMIEHTVAGLPLWYHEGIAEFYSTFTPIGKSVKIGVAPKSHLDYLADRGLMPLKRVFAIDRGSKEYNEAGRSGEFYATSWIFVHYLLVGSPQRSGQLGTFLALLDAKKPADAAFQRAFGTTAEQFQGELWNYLNRPKKQAISYDFPELRAIQIPAPAEVTPSEVREALAPLLAER